VTQRYKNIDVEWTLVEEIESLIKVKDLYSVTFGESEDFFGKCKKVRVYPYLTDKEMKLCTGINWKWKLYVFFRPRLWKKKSKIDWNNPTDYSNWLRKQFDRIDLKIESIEDGWERVSFYEDGYTHSVYRKDGVYRGRQEEKGELPTKPIF